MNKNISDKKKSKHIVVTGYSRSGTTMFYNMLRGSINNYKFMDREYPASAVLGIDNENWITKRPLDIFHIENIVNNNKHGKDLYLLICIRDIRSIITSFHESLPDDYFIGFDYQYSEPPNGQSILTKLGIIVIHNAIVNALNSPYFKKMIIRYEDLLEKPRQVQDDLGATIGFDYIDNFENFYKKTIPQELSRSLHGIRPIDKTRIGRWKDSKHIKRIKDQFSQCPELFDILIEYGYEKDRLWYEEFLKSFPA